MQLLQASERASTQRKRSMQTKIIAMFTFLQTTNDNLMPAPVSIQSSLASFIYLLNELVVNSASFWCHNVYKYCICAYSTACMYACTDKMSLTTGTTTTTSENISHKNVCCFKLIKILCTWSNMDKCVIRNGRWCSALSYADRLHIRSEYVGVFAWW